MVLRRKQQQQQESERDLAPHSYRRALTRTLTSPCFCSARLLSPQSLVSHWLITKSEGMARRKAAWRWDPPPEVLSHSSGKGPGSWTCLAAGAGSLKWQPWEWGPIRTPKSYSETGTLHRIVKKSLVCGGQGGKGENTDLPATMNLHIYFIFEGHFPHLYFRINFNHRIQHP